MDKMKNKISALLHIDPEKASADRLQNWAACAERG
jgi:hypothetical protein